MFWGNSEDTSALTTAASVTTTTAGSIVTSSATSSIATPVDATSTTTTTSTPPLPTLRYSIEARRTGPGGDTVLVLLPPGTYSDLDLEDIMSEVVERFAPIATAYAVDTLDTDGDGVRNPATVVLGVLERSSGFSTAETAFRSDHFFLALEDGFRVVFQGPFEDLPPVILGS